MRGGDAIAAIIIIMDGRGKKIQDVGNVTVGILVNRGIFFDGNDRVIVGCRRRRRYDRNAANFLAAVCIAAVVSYWL